VFTPPVAASLSRVVRTTVIDARPDGAGRLLLHWNPTDATLSIDTRLSPSMPEARDLVRRARQLLPSIGEVEPEAVRIAIYVASNGPLGQRVAGAIADGAIMEACASVYEAATFSAEIATGAARAGRDAKGIKRLARLNTCIASDGRAAREAVRPLVARYLGAGRLRSRTLKNQGLELPAEVLEAVAGAPYAAGISDARIGRLFGQELRQQRGRGRLQCHT
jgi:hypothetical protein